MFINRRSPLIQCSCIVMSFLFLFFQSTIPNVLAATPLTQMSSDQNWIAPESNPQAPAMKPGTPTTPPEEAYIEGYGPNDLGSAPDVSALESGGLSKDTESQKDLSPAAAAVPVAEAVAVPAPAISPLVQQKVVETGGIAAGQAGQDSSEDNSSSDKNKSTPDPTLGASSNATLQPTISSNQGAAASGAAASAAAGTATTDIPDTYGKWASSTVTWGLDYASIDQNLHTYTDSLTSKQKEDGVWSNAVTALSEWTHYVPLTFQEVAADTAAIVIHVLSGEEFDSRWGGQNYVAYSFYPWAQQPTGAGDTGDVFLNGAFTFGLSSAIAGEWSLLATLVHELGHSLGIGHASDSESIMDPYLSNEKTSIAVSDPAVVAVQSLYGVGDGSVVTNVVPTVDAVSDKTLDEDAGTQNINLTGITPGTNETQPVTVTAASSNPGLTGDILINYESPHTTGILSFVPAANASGTATITVQVNDGQLHNNVTTRTFVVTVNPVNDVPTVDPVEDVTVDENTGQKTINLAGITAGANENQPVTVTATSSNPALTGNILVNYTNPNTTGALAFTPIANMTGTATITVSVNDGTAVTQKVFTLTVNPDTQAPVVTPVAPVTARGQAVNFTAVAGATGYEVQVSRNTDFSTLIELQHPVVTTNQFQLPDFSAGNFYVRVRALQGSGETKNPLTVFSAAQQITMNATYPVYMPPLSYAQGGVDVNILDWNPSANANVTGYNVYRRVFGSADWILVQNAGMNIRFFDHGIDTDTAYQYEVRAYTGTTIKTEIPTPMEVSRSANYDKAYQGLQPENILVLINTKSDGLGYVDLGIEVPGVWSTPQGILDENRTGKDILLSLGYSSANGSWSDPHGLAVTGGTEAILLSLGYKAIESLRMITEADLLTYLGLDAGSWQDNDHDGIYVLPEWHVLKNADGTIEVPLGIYYAMRRGIPKDNIVFVSTMPTGERDAFSEDDFNDMIDMIHDAMVARGIADKITSVVSAYHFPLVHGGGHGWAGPGGSTMDAGDYSWEEGMNYALWESFGGDRNDCSTRTTLGRGFSRLLGDSGFLSTRIDAADVRTARRMIDDSIWAEENYRFGDSAWTNPGLSAYVDWNSSRSWLPADCGFQQAARIIGASGFFGAQGTNWDSAPDITAAWINSHSPEWIEANTKPDPDGSGRLLANTFLFTGWYEPNNYQDLFDWARGALGWSLDSFSGRTYRGEQFYMYGIGLDAWGGNIISHGAAATLGAVNEPGLMGHTKPNSFMYALLNGYSFAEAGYYGTPLENQMSFNGDPLYAPFNASDSGDHTRVVPVLTGGVITGYRYMLSEPLVYEGGYSAAAPSYREYDLNGRLVKEQLTNGTQIEYLPDGRTVFYNPGVTSTPYSQGAVNRFDVYDAGGQLLHSAIIPGRCSDAHDQVEVLTGGRFEIHRYYKDSNREDVFDQNGVLIRFSGQVPIVWTGTAAISAGQIVPRAGRGDITSRINRSDGSYVVFTPVINGLDSYSSVEYRSSAGELLASLSLADGIYRANFTQSGFSLQEVRFSPNAGYDLRSNMISLLESFLSYGTSFSGDLNGVGGLIVSRAQGSAGATGYGVTGAVHLVPGVQPPRISSITRGSDGARFDLVYSESGAIQSANLYSVSGSVLVSAVKNQDNEYYSVQDVTTGLLLSKVAVFSAESLYNIVEGLPKLAQDRTHYRESLIGYLVSQGADRDSVLAQVPFNFSGIINSLISLDSLYSFTRRLEGGVTESYRGDISYDFNGVRTLKNALFAPDGTKIVFDANLRVTQTTLPNGIIRDYQYFAGCAASRLVKETFPDSDSNPSNNPTDNYYYTAQGVLQYQFHTDSQGQRVYYAPNGQEIARSVNGVVTFRVDPTHAFLKTIADALQMARSGDVLELAAGTYHEGNFTFGVNITIRGAGAPGSVIIDGSAFSDIRRFAVINKNVLFENLTIKNFDIGSNPGGAISVTSGANFRALNCVFENNVSNGGGAIYSRGATVTLEGCEFRSNQGGHFWGSGEYPIGGGAIMTDMSTLNVSGCRFIGNFGIVGGAIHVYEGSTAVIERSFFDGNRGGDGSAIEVGVSSTLSTATINRCTFVNNTGGPVVHAARGREWASGFQLVFTDSGSTVNLTQSILANNSGGDLGADSFATLNAQNCLLQAAWPGTGNITGNPLFLDAAHGDYRILRTSPAVTLGNPNVAWGSAGFAPPQIVLPQGLEGTATNKRDFVVTYTVDGQTKTQPFTLQDGVNALHITEIDELGQETTVGFHVTLDQTAPVVIVSIDPALTFANGRTVTIESTVTVRYTVDGVAQPPMVITLAVGDNELVIPAQHDPAGNITPAQTLYVTRRIPVIVVTSEIPARTDQSTITVTFTVDGGAEQSTTFMLGEGNNSGMALAAQDSTWHTIATYTLPDIFRNATPPGPVITVTSEVPMSTDKAQLVVTFTVDGGAEQSQTFSLTVGNNSGLILTGVDASGNIVSYALPDIWRNASTQTPSIVVTSQVPTVTNQRILTVTFTVDGGAEQSQTFTLMPGDNAGLVLTAKDETGSVLATYALPSVRFDETAPVVVITSAVPEVTNQKTLTINYTVDGVAQTPMVITLTEGDNAVVIPEQHDAAGNITPAQTLHVTRDTQAPVVVVSTAPSLDFTKGTPVTNKTTLTINYTVDGVAQTPMVIALTEGDNLIAIPEQIDAAGNVTPAQTLHVTRDTEGPEVVVTDDVPATTDQAKLVVNYTVDGVAQTPLTFDLVEGVNTIRIPSVADEYGNMSEEQAYEVTREVAASEIIVTSEVPATTKEPSFTVSYTVDGVVHSQTFQLTDGANALVLNAVDALGHATQKTLQVELDRVAPVIKLSEDLPSVIGIPAIYVSYTVDGESRMIVLPLVEGDNTDLKLTAMDAAGNESVLHLPNVRYEKPPVSTSAKKASGAGALAAEESPAPAQSTALSVADFRVYYSSLNLSALQQMRVSQSLDMIQTGAFVYRYDTDSGPSFSWVESGGHTRVFSFEDNILLFGELLAPVLS